VRAPSRRRDVGHDRYGRRPLTILQQTPAAFAAGLSVRLAVPVDCAALLNMTGRAIVKDSDHVTELLAPRSLAGSGVYILKTRRARQSEGALKPSRESEYTR